MDITPFFLVDKERNKVYNIVIKIKQKKKEE